MHVRDTPLDSGTPAISSSIDSQTSALTSYLIGVYQQCMTSGMNCYVYCKFSPSRADLIARLEALELQTKIYQPPFYSNEADISKRSSEFAGLVYHLDGGKGTASLEEFMPTPESVQYPYNYPWFEAHSGWEFASLPPSRRAIRRWLKHETRSRKKLSNRKTPRSQV